ncbi:UV excision repair protein rad23 [Elasticomyces elasticus]|uniref:UV excision repair protein RAD23 n=1 Tax=Elasticomyces elasticus TaxID=574655 RepID=A0AAN7ZPE2_9PEZI|nr:UV excision repair protein rad23 [Elasticomyces elasticus]KAK4979895.1 UV excision repair protein rad23 [Elasticomyces elasticus]KAK5702917.1 UV excision repair protein rad23 [Elasticomyces elasticus]KAK5730459.1 UV excision repair protein rad23 [Elasticomyces elasticus]
MKLTFKDLKQQRFTIDAEPTETISAVKQKISTEKGWEPSTQKLIYSGKILQDDNTIESYKIEEKGFIVCMTSKPKAAPKPAAEPSTPAKPASASTPAPPPAPAAAPASSTSQPPATPSPAGASAAPSSTNFNDPSALALGEQRSAAISNMEAMGFPRDQIDRAMRAAFFNPDRAVEYLLNGIPASAEQEQRTAAASPRPASNQAQTPAATGNTGAAPTTASGDEPVNLFEAAAQAGTRGGSGGARGAGAGAGGAGDLAAALGGQGGAGNAANLEFLRNNPQFQQLRQVVQQQPQMLEPILQQVAAGNPQLAQLITQNPEQFMQLLAEDADDDVALPPGAQQVAVTEEEREAIERLCRLGFERDLVIQAYFACDKNEELAANFLFEQPDEPDEPAA